MRSDAILKLFSKYSLSGAGPNDHVALRFAEHISLRYQDIPSSELAFFLRVGGQLVRQKMEDCWNAVDTSTMRPDFFAGREEDDCHVDSHHLLFAQLDSTTPLAANDGEYDRVQHEVCAAGRADPTAYRPTNRLRLISKTESVSTWLPPSALKCMEIQSAEPDRLKELFDSLKNEVERARSIIASSKSLIDRSKDLRDAIDFGPKNKIDDAHSRETITFRKFE